MDIPITELRSRLAQHGSKGTVRVNQKSLIDKLLARYKGENTMFRELVQNADDAGASCVVIEIDTNVPNSDKGTVRISNNGRPFTEDDWDRLQSIADGNPDENITGMFGVGFYSVFALSSSPIVRSGRSALMFEWMGNQLATSRLDDTVSAQSQDSKWSDVVLDAVSGQICKSLIAEGGLKLSRYLSEMLPFSRNLQKIQITQKTKRREQEREVDTPLLLYEVRKETRPLPHLSSKKGGRSQAGYFEMLTGIVSSEVKLIFSTKRDTPDQTENKTTSTEPSTTDSAPQQTSPQIHYSVEMVSLTLVEAALGVKLDHETAKGVKEVLKKNAPSKTRVALVLQRDADLLGLSNSNGNGETSGTIAAATSYIKSYFSSAMSYAFGASPTITTETKPASPTAGNAPSAIVNRFQGRQGNIFVGFSTGQDTGCLIDISAQLYPTMEREHIDMNGFVGKWNIDLLHMCGVVLRVFYDCLVGLLNETVEVPKQQKGKGRNKYKKGNATVEPVPQKPAPAETYFPEMLSFARALKFAPTSPSKEVSQLLKSGFFYKDEGNTLRVPSSSGTVMAVSRVKLPCMGLEKFVNSPLLHDQLVDNMVLSNQTMSKKQKAKAGVVASFTMSPCFANVLMEKGLIAPIRTSDLIEEMKEDDTVLTEERLVKFLHAIVRWSEDGVLGKESVSSLLGYLRWIPDTNANNSRHFSMVKYFLNEDIFASLTPTGEPQSTTALEHALESTGEVLHFRLTKQFSSTQLERVFQLQKITTQKVCELISTPSSHRILFADPVNALPALVLFSRNYSLAYDAYLSQLQRSRCMPTDHADTPLALPADTYFPNVSAGQKLLHVSSDIAGMISRNFLVSLGVHETVSTKTLLEVADTQGNDIGLVIGQLVEMHSRLHPDDWEHLRATKFLPAMMKTEDGSKVKSRESADSVLFSDPKNVLIELGFKILDWGEGASKLQKNFLKDVGVKAHPDLKALLTVAATTKARDTCFKAITYLLDNFDIYRKDYTSAINEKAHHEQGSNKKKGHQSHSSGASLGYLSFLPVSTHDRSLVRRNPKQCYITPIISEDLRQYLNLVNGVDMELTLRRPDLKDKLHIPQNPPVADMVTEMGYKGLPVSIAKECFDYLGTHCIGSFQEEHWKSLKVAKFIPIPEPRISETKTTTATAQNGAAKDSAKVEPQVVSADPSPPTIKWMKPAELVLESEQVKQQYRSLLDYVPAAYGGKIFLRGCGIPEYPDDERFCGSLIRNHRRFFMNEDLKLYINSLYTLNDMYPRLSSTMTGRLTDTPCFVALRGTNVELCRASDTVLVDNQVYCNMFEPLAAPRDTDLENLYGKLGAKWLTSCIVTKYVPSGTPKATPTSQKYYNLIEERQQLFIYDPDTRQAKPDLKPNVQQILKGIKVMEVDSITKNLTYRGQTKSFPEEVGLQNPTSTVILISSNNKPQSSTAKFESETLHGISRVLASLLFVRLKYSEASQIFFVLRNSIESLESEGFPVAALAKKPSTDSSGKKQQPTQLIAEDSETPKPLDEQTLAAGKKKNPEEIVSGKGKKERERMETYGDEEFTPGTYNPEGWNKSLDGAVSRKPNSKAPPTEVQEAGGVFPIRACEITVAQRLTMVPSFQPGLPTYEEGGQEHILSDETLPVAKDFVKVLRGLASSVFKLPSIENTVAIFVNTEHRRNSSAASIAFNLGGRLYFNFAYYLDYQTNTPIYQVWYYWFMTFCHEIAHNIEENHNQRHEHIIEALQAKFFPQFCDVIGVRVSASIPNVN